MLLPPQHCIAEQRNDTSCIRWYGTGMLWTWVDGHGGWAATYRCCSMAVFWLRGTLQVCLPVIVVIAYWLSCPMVHACRRQLAALPSVVVQTVGRSCKVQMFDWRAAGWSGPPLSFKIWHLEEGFQRAMEVCGFSAAWSPCWHC